MSLTEIGIVAIDVVFAVAVLAAMSALRISFYVTIREHGEPSVSRAGAVHGRCGRPGARFAPAELLRSLRPSAVHQRISSSLGRRVRRTRGLSAVV